jgi:hypothetical protein
MFIVPNQLVGAPSGTDVTIDCHTEAHPRLVSDNVLPLILFLLQLLSKPVAYE